jgi:hypothetical protein
MKIPKHARCLAALLSLAASTGAWAAPAEVLFQGLVDRRVVESKPNSAWLFKRPLASSMAPPYVIYESEKILKLMPGDRFQGRLDIDRPGGPHGALDFVVTWEETNQKIFRSLHGEIRSPAARSEKIGTFRFTSKLGGTEMTGCVQIGDRDYCFVGKYGVGWMS